MSLFLQDSIAIKKKKGINTAMERGVKRRALTPQHFHTSLLLPLTEQDSRVASETLDQRGSALGPSPHCGRPMGRKPAQCGAQHF